MTYLPTSADTNAGLLVCDSAPATREQRAGTNFVLVGFKNGLWREVDSTGVHPGETEQDAIEFLKDISRYAFDCEEVKVVTREEFNAMRIEFSDYFMSMSPTTLDFNGKKFTVIGLNPKFPKHSAFEGMKGALFDVQFESGQVRSVLGIEILKRSLSKRSRVKAPF